MTNKLVKHNALWSTFTNLMSIDFWEISSSLDLEVVDYFGHSYSETETSVKEVKEFRGESLDPFSVICKHDVN